MKKIESVIKDVFLFIQIALVFCAIGGIVCCTIYWNNPTISRWIWLLGGIAIAILWWLIDALQLFTEWLIAYNKRLATNQEILAEARALLLELRKEKS